MLLQHHTKGPVILYLETWFLTPLHLQVTGDAVPEDREAERSPFVNSFRGWRWTSMQAISPMLRENGDACGVAAVLPANDTW